MSFSRRRVAFGILVAVAVTISSCNPARPVPEIKITGSETMVALASAWQKAYLERNPGVTFRVAGGGSGVGIGALCSGSTDIATASRPMKEEEYERAKANTGKTPVEFKVGLDALAIYVNKNNPIASISIPELAGIFGADGKIDHWSDLGVENKDCHGGQILRVSRSENSGTSAYFQEAVLGEDGLYKSGALTQSSPAEVLAAIGKSPCAIGYSGLEHRAVDVKKVPVSKEKGQPAIAPSRESAADGTYPISRQLFIYTLGQPTGSLKAFVEWCQEPAGQKIAEEVLGSSKSAE